MSAILLSLLAGALTVVNPCVLPVLPFVLFGALQQHRLGPLALAGGMVTGFTILGLLVYGAGSSFTAESVRQAGAVLMLLMGVIILCSPLKNRLAAAGSRWTGPLHALLDRASAGGQRGLNGQFVTGALLGAIWSPCSGPTLGSAVALAAQGGLPRATLIMLFFGIGAMLPMLALAYGSRQAIAARRDWLVRMGRIAMPVMGALLIAIGLVVLSGLDKQLEGALLDVMPDWLVQLTTRF